MDFNLPLYSLAMSLLHLWVLWIAIIRLFDTYQYTSVCTWIHLPARLLQRVKSFYIFPDVSLCCCGPMKDISSNLNILTADSARKGQTGREQKHEVKVWSGHLPRRVKFGENGIIYGSEPKIQWKFESYISAPNEKIGLKFASNFDYGFHSNLLSNRAPQLEVSMVDLPNATRLLAASRDRQLNTIFAGRNRYPWRSAKTLTESSVQSFWLRLHYLRIQRKVSSCRLRTGLQLKCNDNSDVEVPWL